MNLATDFDFSTPNNAALSLKTIAELVRQEKLKCEASEQSFDGLTLKVSTPSHRSK